MYIAYCVFFYENEDENENNLFELFFQLSFGFFGNVVVDKYTSAVFADNDFLVHLDFGLALRRNLAEASTAGVAVDSHHCQSVASCTADALVGRQVARLYELFLLFRFGAQAGFVLLSLFDDVVEFVFLGVKVFVAVLEQQFGSGDVLSDLFDVGVSLFDVAFAELYLKVFVFYLLVYGLEFTVVAHIVLLFLILLDHLSVLCNLVLLVSHLLVGFRNVVLEVLDASLQTGNFVLKVLDCLWQFATDDLDFVDFGVDGLQGVEGYESFFNGNVDIELTDCIDNGCLLGVFFFVVTFFAILYIIYIFCS